CKMKRIMSVIMAAFIITALLSVSVCAETKYPSPSDRDYYVASVVNALSSHMIVEVRRDGKIFRDEYRDGGHPVVALEKGLLPAVGKCAKTDTGTKVTFYPDDTIFETVEFKPEVISKHLKESAFLNKGLIINSIYN
ncbi:MAG: DNA topoisomerase IV subunit B, partial [Clostridia bacterium]|nr:DNA topoisomerase IV subunit B [Clostridia bacterium]